MLLDRAGTAEQKPPSASRLHFFPHEILMLSFLKKGKYQSSNGSLAIATGSVASLATAAEVLLVLGEKATEKSSKRRHRKTSKMEKNTKDREEGSGAVCVYARLRFTL